jgi:sugar phosphate isomerase/epimerase
VSDPAKSIRIGTMINATGGNAAERIAEIADLGFESFEPFFWQTTNGQDLAELGKRCLDAIGNRDITLSTIGMFGNPLEGGEMDRETLRCWIDCIDNAHHFGATCVAGFTGRLRGQPLTLPRSLLAQVIQFEGERIPLLGPQGELVVGFGDGAACRRDAVIGHEQHALVADDAGERRHRDAGR